MNKSLYLCGPITGCNFGEAKFGWRGAVHEALTPLGIDCLSPMRSKEPEHYDTDNGDIMPAHGSDLHVLSTAKGLTECDRFDTFRSDILFCNVVGAKRISVGSMIELGWADAKDIPIILCMEAGNVHEHGMVEHLASWHVLSVKEGIQLVQDLFTTDM